MSGWKVSPRAWAVLSAWAWGPCHCWWWYGSLWASYNRPGAGWRGPGEQLRPYNKFKTKLVVLHGSVYPRASLCSDGTMWLSRPWSSARSYTRATRRTWCSGRCPGCCPQGRTQDCHLSSQEANSANIQFNSFVLAKALKTQISGMFSEGAQLLSGNGCAVVISESGYFVQTCHLNYSSTAILLTPVSVVSTETLEILFESKLTARNKIDLGRRICYEEFEWDWRPGATSCLLFIRTPTDNPISGQWYDQRGHDIW